MRQFRPSIIVSPVRCTAVGQGGEWEMIVENRALTVEIFLEETAEHTDAKAVLDLGPNTFTGWGRARRNPVDPNVPKVGEELATARALNDLSHKLLDAAAGLIETFEGRRVHLHT